MQYGQGTQTESGAYELLGGTPTPTNAKNLQRNPGARYFLPTHHEWYKAAFYDPVDDRDVDSADVLDFLANWTGIECRPPENAETIDATVFPVGTATRIGDHDLLTTAGCFDPEFTEEVEAEN